MLRVALSQNNQSISLCRATKGISLLMDDKGPRLRRHVEGLVGEDHQPRVQHNLNGGTCQWEEARQAEHLITYRIEKVTPCIDARKGRED
jgi:hypothetical protein